MRKSLELTDLAGHLSEGFRCCLTIRGTAFCRWERVCSKWGNRVLVARLEPADIESRDEFGRIIADRNDLSVRFQEHFGFKITDYSPHVSLGYFANKEYAELATPQIDRWIGLCEKEAGDLTVAFGSVSLYGFTDMATFFKAG
jgi:hypothetical protein